MQTKGGLSAETFLYNDTHLIAFIDQHINKLCR